MAGPDGSNDGPPRAKRRRLVENLRQLRREALLANPWLDFDGPLLLKRKRGQLGLPVNHKCNSGIPQTGYDNEIALLSPGAGQGTVQTIFRPEAGRYVGEIDLHFDAHRLLFTMPNGRTRQIREIRPDGTGLRQVSRGEHPDVDNFDACYLPDGRKMVRGGSWSDRPKRCRSAFRLSYPAGQGVHNVGFRVVCAAEP